MACLLYTSSRNYPGKVLSYIDDLKLHVFEMRKLPKEIRNLFQSDMRIVVDYLAAVSYTHLCE